VDAKAFHRFKLFGAIMKCAGDVADRLGLVKQDVFSELLGGERRLLAVSVGDAPKNTRSSSLVQFQVHFYRLHVPYQLSTKVATNARIGVHAFLVIVKVDFKFANVRASWNVATQRALCKMSQNVTLQHDFVVIKFTAHFACKCGKFLDPVRFWMRMQFDGRRANLLAFFEEAREDPCRLHLVLFQVIVEMTKSHESGAAVLTRIYRDDALLWRFVFQRGIRALHLHVLLELYFRGKAFAAIGAWNTPQTFLVLGHVFFQVCSVDTKVTALVKDAI
jgi:hypothetical protein